ncbi:hypothetical protein MKJ01_18425 [Chryseobacterium sp. SSA4.19]|uniref:hypothetical protein n=1 Tax=Chryseobacterium sp. SSA4.19 TaxID=2919915 RepID=UPI001F4DBDC9|nr:hypothetical protein [Chryseobacterium sp. SSA4.19]MCJ8155735.1 hypothetical protein [Chryseobacterium sp. SSA4.19]
MKLTIPKPCHENWDTMTPEEKGRFCSVCSKTVRDFTAAADEDLAEAFSRPSGNVCGRFNASQLNRDLQYSYINSLFAKFAVGFVLTSGGFISVQAQQVESKTESVKNTRIKGKAAPGVMKNDTAYTRHLILGGIHPVSLKNNLPLYVIDGKISTERDFKALDSKSIKKLEVMKSAVAIDLFGEKAKNGVLLVTTKRKRKQ